MKLYIKITNKEQDKLNKNNGYRKDIFLEANNIFYQLTCVTLYKLSKLSHDIMNNEIINIIEDNIVIVKKLKEKHIIKAVKTFFKNCQIEVFKASVIAEENLKIKDYNITIF